MGGSTVNNVNKSGQDYIGLVMLVDDQDSTANTAGTIDTDHQSIHTDGDGDVNLSISRYTGNATAGATVGHGLDGPPDLIMIKNLTTAGTEILQYANTMYLDETEGMKVVGSGTALATDSTYWNDTAPTDTLVSLGTNTLCNKSGDDYVMICIREKLGFFQLFDYTGCGVAGAVNTCVCPAWGPVRWDESHIINYSLGVKYGAAWDGAMFKARGDHASTVHPWCYYALADPGSHWNTGPAGYQLSHQDVQWGGYHALAMLFGDGTFNLPQCGEHVTGGD